MTNKFVHLHVHSDASLKDGLTPVHKLIEVAKARGFEALALTDHGTLANAVSFALGCEEVGIKPILGVEGYVRFGDKIGHITLLADGDKGFSNLIKLQNKAHSEYVGNRASFSIDDLIAHADSLLCLSGCVSSPLHQLDYSDAKDLAKRLRSAFGHRFFIELMTVGDDPVLWERPQKLSTDLNIKQVLTNDAHFPLPQHAQVHPILTQIKAGFEYNSRELWLKTPKELLARALKLSIGSIEEPMDRAYSIGRKIKSVNIKRKASLPHIENADKKLAGLVRDEIKNRSLGTIYRTRADFELKVINDMDYSAYFLILYDIVSEARRRGSRVGPGRGSGAGSLVLYLLGVTEVDPLQYDLSFERFLNPARASMPDVDVDFDSETRHEILYYASKRWGAIPVATYSRFNHKSLIHDLAKTFRLTRADEETIAEEGPDCDCFKQAVIKQPLFGDSYDAILGQIRHKGKHAGGIVITSGEVPIERAGDDLVAAWVEGGSKELSVAGIVKFDLLGLTTLSTLRRLETKLKVKPEPPTDGHPLFELFRKGDVSGIFQFTGSSGIQSLTKKVAPETFEDLIAITALYRPGALDAGTADKYPDFKKSPRLIHPLVDPILKPTYGVIIYQEQVMAIYAAVTGGTQADADLARKVIVRSKVGDHDWELQIAELKDKFLAGAEKQKIQKKIALMLWSEIFTHSRYSFNKSHAVAYTVISWECAWWKWFHRTAFYAEMLNVDAGNASLYLSEAIRNGIEVTMPNVTHSGVEYDYDELKKVIYMPLIIVKGLALKGANAIVSAREEKPFSSVKDFVDRVPKRLVNSKSKKGLAAIGAFSGLDGDEGDLGLKEVLPTMTLREAQKAYTGIVLPTEEQFKRIDEKLSTGMMAGMIVSTTEKSSVYGDYTVYKLMPEGTFWSREQRDLEVGQIVYVKVRQDTGKATKIELGD